jgi:hypothetical protein
MRSGGLQGFDAIDVNQGDVSEVLRAGVVNGNSLPTDGEHFRVSDLEGFSVGEPELEGLERPPIQPFPNRFRVHRIRLSARRSNVPQSNYTTAAGVFEGE